MSRMFGMIRDMTFAHYLGADWLMTAWTMGFKIPNLSRRLFGEGAASASFIPVYSEQLHIDPRGAERLADTVVTVLFLLLAGFVLLGEVFVWGFYHLSQPNPGTATGLTLCGIMLPYMVLVCLVAIVAGILNVHRHFAAPAAAPIVLNIFVITGLVITGEVLDIPARRQVFYVAFGVLLAGLAQLAIQVPPLRAAGVRLRPAWGVRSEAFRKVLVLMGPMLLGLTVTQINTLADDLIALAFSNDRGEPLGWGAVSHLYYAQRMYQFPLGVLGISLATAVFPVMSADAARKDYQALCKTISRGFGAAVFVALPATVGILLVARPLVSRHETDRVDAFILRTGFVRLFFPADRHAGILFDTGLPGARDDGLVCGVCQRHAQPGTSVVPRHGRPCAFHGDLLIPAGCHTGADTWQTIRTIHITGAVGGYHQDADRHGCNGAGGGGRTHRHAEHARDHCL